MSSAKFKTMRHIETVRNYLNACIKEILERQETHDQTKLESPELEIFEVYTPKLRKCTYGSEEYNKYLVEMDVALKHHYANNKHHPEHDYIREGWKSVVGYEDLYQVSTFGRVKNTSGKILALQTTPKGYLRLSLAKDGNCKNYMVHRLVANAFIDNPGNKPEVNHKNGDKKDNEVGNLEWATTSENLIHAYETSLRYPAIKYFIHCVELDIVTAGAGPMERELRNRGYQKALASGIWRAMDEEGKHLDLTFVGYPISEGNPQSMVGKMTIIDLIEMICDWKASSMRHDNGSIMKSIEDNQIRFGYSDGIKTLLKNTAKWLDDLQVPHKAQES